MAFSCGGAVLRTPRFGGSANPSRECLWCPAVHAAAERERASPQPLTHPRGKTIDLPDFPAHRTEGMRPSRLVRAAIVLKPSTLLRACHRCADGHMIVVLSWQRGCSYPALPDTS